MPEHISFPSIEQFRNTVADVRLRATFTGKDEAGDPIYDEALPKPTLRFTGTVKLHGTNASVCCDSAGNLWCQSREAILTPEQDNAGFARFAMSRPAVFLALLSKLEATAVGVPAGATFAIYGEWCGKGIHSGVGICSLPKSFFIFAAKAVTEDTEVWLDSSGLSDTENGIYNVENYPKYTMDIDFNNPEAALEPLIRLTEAVDALCPIANALGISGTGEGIVWKSEYTGKLLLFKVKGEKHKISDAKKVVTVDAEKLATSQEFAGYAVTDNRFNQAIEHVCGTPANADLPKLGDLIRWMQGDIIKEESDTLLASGLTLKDVGSAIAAKTKEKLQAMLSNTL